MHADRGTVVAAQGVFVICQPPGGDEYRPADGFYERPLPAGQVLAREHFPPPVVGDIVDLAQDVEGKLKAGGLQAVLFQDALHLPRGENLDVAYVIALPSVDRQELAVT